MATSLSSRALRQVIDRSNVNQQQQIATELNTREVMRRAGQAEEKRYGEWSLRNESDRRRGSRFADCDAIPSASLAHPKPCPQMTAEKDNSRLTRRQEQAIGALLLEPTIARAAQSAAISERTLRRWLERDNFRAAFMVAWRGAVTQATARAAARSKCGQLRLDEYAAAGTLR